MPLSSRLPSNVHISLHPCLVAKISQLRSSTTNARETKDLVNEISLILACESLSSSLLTRQSGIDKTPLGHEYKTITTFPSLTLVPILRSGLGMLDAFQLILPQPVSIHHLGLYREPTTLQPVEYYNNLPHYQPTTDANADDETKQVPAMAVILDPVIATGGTASAAIQTLFEWGVRKVLLVSIIGNAEGVLRAASQVGEEAKDSEVEIWVGAVDEGLNDKGMIRPGLGDIGDRLFGTLGK